MPRSQRAIPVSNLDKVKSFKENLAHWGNTNHSSAAGKSHQKRRMIEGFIFLAKNLDSISCMHSVGCEQRSVSCACIWENDLGVGVRFKTCEAVTSSLKYFTPY